VDQNIERPAGFLDMNIRLASGCTFDLVSVKSINYACAVNNDTPITCTVGVKVQMGIDP